MRVSEKMEGIQKKRILVHRGFYNYLFNNSFIDGQQRYDNIIQDIRSVFEAGYRVCVTGHRYGH